jgi:hypothetical protein
MKFKTIIILVLSLAALVLFTSESNGQERTEMSKGEQDRLDSLQTLYKRDEIRAQREKDENTIADAKQDKRETKAKAKEAQRIEREANDAARESRYALRTEKKAQKARKNADAQAKKALKARNRSDKN